MASSKARPNVPQIITANDLLSGDVIYLADDRQWASHLGRALIIHSHEEAKLLLEWAERQGDKIIGAYLTPVAIGKNGQAEPAHFREAFRAKGPSNYFHGKQQDATEAAQ